MAISFNPVHPVFAAECQGIDISRPLAPEERDAIERAMDQYGVLVFRQGAPLTTDQQLAFTTSFGPIEPPYTQIRSVEGTRLDNPALVDISNLAPGDRIMARDDRKRLFGLGNMLWHSDSSYKETPAKWSLLCAHVIPPEGAETEIADMRVAWDMLEPRIKDKVRDLVCEHSRIFSKGALGFGFTEQELHDFAPVRQPLVRRHPGSGRLSLFLSSHNGRVVGMPVPEAMMLLRELTEHATQRAFVYSHKWRVGDLLVWDNLCTMHRARPFDDAKYPRDMRRTTLAGEAAVPVSTALAAE